MAMRKNVEAVVSAMGILLDIVVSLVAMLKARGANVGEAVYKLGTKEGKQVLEQIAELIVQSGKPVGKAFRLILKPGRTTDEVVKAGNYDWAYNWINGRNFPWRDRPEGEVFIELIDMDRDFTFDEALEALKKHGLTQPVYEDGLLFGEKHPDEQRTAPIMFPHEPVRGEYGHPYVVYLYENDNGRKLNLNHTGNRWYRNVRVAGVRNSLYFQPPTSLGGRFS